MLAPILRSAAQSLVGALAAYLAARGLGVPEDLQVQVTLGLTAVLTGLIAKGQHLVEARYPELGNKLRSPAYPSRKIDFAALEQALREMGLVESGIDPETGDPFDEQEISSK